MLSAGSKLATNNGRHARSQQLYGPQHLLMRERRDTHLERNAGQSAECLVHVEDLLRNRVGIPNEERAGGPA
jgi:hypothetical protein